MPDLYADESLIRAVLAEHREAYDTDCGQHFGCACDELTADENYWADGAYHRTREAWLDHVMDKIREVVMAGPTPAKCVPSTATDDDGDRRCLTHRQWWPDETSEVCPEVARGT